ncbi:hypothetical protein MMC29_004005 [Sticta canariensis]|nr:hypothetical protein [Sticta canariensis]
MVSTKPCISLVIRTRDVEYATSIVCAWFHFEVFETPKKLSFPDTFSAPNKLDIVGKFWVPNMLWMPDALGVVDAPGIVERSGAVGRLRVVDVPLAVDAPRVVDTPGIHDTLAVPDASVVAGAPEIVDTSEAVDMLRSPNTLLAPDVLRVLEVLDSPEVPDTAVKRFCREQRDRNMAWQLPSRADNLPCWTHVRQSPFDVFITSVAASSNFCLKLTNVQELSKEVDDSPGAKAKGEFLVAREQAGDRASLIQWWKYV